MDEEWQSVFADYTETLAAKDLYFLITLCPIVVAKDLYKFTDYSVPNNGCQTLVFADYFVYL